MLGKPKRNMSMRSVANKLKVKMV